MFANRFTAVIDACVLAAALKRNLVLTLAEAEFFRVRWSDHILEETRIAIGRILRAKGAPDAETRAERAIVAMNLAFEEARVLDYAGFIPVSAALPDHDDAHLIAAALKARAELIVTDNLKHFPPDILEPLNLEARSADTFLADTLALDPGRAVAAVRRMRQRFKKPEKSAEQLLLDMEVAGLTATVDVLRPYVDSL